MEARDEILKFQTHVEMIPQEKAAVEGDIETLSELIHADADIPPPELPHEDFQFNTQLPCHPNALLPDETPTELVALGRELAELNRALVEVSKRTDGRNASVRSLKKRVSEITKQMATLDQVTGLAKVHPDQ
ncbi:hypothetical protein [Dictyobacter halimunensis]